MSNGRTWAKNAIFQKVLLGMGSLHFFVHAHVHPKIQDFEKYPTILKCYLKVRFYTKNILFKD